MSRRWTGLGLILLLFLASWGCVYFQQQNQRVAILREETVTLLKELKEQERINKSLEKELRDLQGANNFLGEKVRSLEEKNSILEEKVKHLEEINNSLQNSLQSLQKSKPSSRIRGRTNLAEGNNKLWVIATAYSPDDPGVNHCTATGTCPEEGRTVAVDPRVIPYGSRIYIPGYGWRIAEDTGGAIKGSRIDLYFEKRQAALNFGRQKIEILVQ